MEGAGFRDGYDQLNEHELLEVRLPAEPPPTDVRLERDWCLQAELITPVGSSELATSFADSTARYYAYLRARRFFDFGTVQSELTRRLDEDEAFRTRFPESATMLLFDLKGISRSSG